MTSTTTLEPQTFFAENRDDYLSSARRPVVWNGVIIGEWDKATRRSGTVEPAFLILQDITRLIGLRYNGPVDTDDDEMILEVALPFLRSIVSHPKNIDSAGNTIWDPWTWAQTYTPRLVAERGQAWLFQAMAGAGRKLTMDGIAQAFQITPEEAARCNFHSLVDYTRNREVRAEERKTSARVRMDALRRKKGALTRTDYLAQAEAKRREAEALGITVRTLERRREKARKEHGEKGAST